MRCRNRRRIAVKRGRLVGLTRLAGGFEASEHRERIAPRAGSRGDRFDDWRNGRIRGRGPAIALIGHPDPQRLGRGQQLGLALAGFQGLGCLEILITHGVFSS